MEASANMYPVYGLQVTTVVRVQEGDAIAL